MKNWTIQKLVSNGFAVIILISMLICGVSVYRLLEIQNESAELRISHVPSLYYASQLLQTTLEDNIHLLSYVYEKDPDRKAYYKDQMAKDSEKNNVNIEKRHQIAEREKESSPLIARVDHTRTVYLGFRDEMVALDRDGKSAEALDLYEAKVLPALKNYLGALNKLQDNDHAEADNNLETISKAVGDANRALWVGSAASLLICVTIAIAVIRMLGVTLKNLMLSLIQVNGSATEMAATIKEQQASANEVASTSVEIGATAKEISATTQELGKTMSDVAGVSEQTAALAAGGQSGLNRLEGTMRQIMGATTSISSKLAILNEKTANINSMVTTINKVADQTNLLSLNAAIEAEKAGEYGQGFAVVATEIRRLADQTAVATYDIEQMVKEMQSAVSAGVMGMDKFAEEVRRGNEEVCAVTAQLGQIISQVQALTPRFESVNEGMQMQSTAAGQISDALTQLGDTAQQSAQALRQNSEAIEQLTKAAQGLQLAAAQLKSGN